ncbi:MAG: 2-5 ligase [Acidimicrobiales bacterium]|nr:2-5 ligase [Acidimicrobiales bacterium]
MWWAGRVTKRHLAVVLTVPAPLATEIDGLRRATGDPRRERIVPHVTLVPPTNVQEEDVPQVLADLRVAAAASHALDLTIGPVATFAPVTPLAYLSVSGDPTELDALDRLRRDLAVGPFARPLKRRFVPHVTISGEHPEARLAAIVEALGGWRVDVQLGTVSLMEHPRTPRSPWRPLAEEVLGLPQPRDAD